MNEQVMDPATLLAPQATMMMSIMDSAYYLQMRHAAFIKPPPVGKYLPHGTTPVLSSDRTYNTQHRQGIPYFELATIREDLFDANWKLVLPAAVMSDQSRYLTDQPSIPVNALNIVRHVMEAFIAEKSAWDTARAAEMNIFRYLQGSCDHLVYDYVLQTDIDAIIRPLHQFILHHEWYIHHIRFAGLDVSVERASDYRAYQWTQMQFDKHHQQQEGMFG